MKERKSVIGRLVAAAALALMLAPTCSFGFSGEGTAGLVDGVYVVTVPGGKEANIQGTDATAANDANAPIAKRGAGTLYAGSGFGSFAGEFRVEEGGLWLNHNNSLGTTAGGTVVSNGALLAFRTTENNLTYPGEAIALAGKIQNSSQKPMLDAFPGSITIIGDTATFDGYPIGLCGTLALDGHLLTISMNNSSYLLLRGVDITSGGTIALENGHFKMSGDNVISARDACNFPLIEVEDGGSLANEVFGYGGNVAALTKTGDNTFTFANSLTVTGETYVAAGTLKIGGTESGTAGLVAAVTNFNKSSNAEWLGFVGAANQDAVASKDLYVVATNLLSIGEEQGFAVTANRAEAAYNSWTADEKYKLGAYRGYIWNNDATNKVYTFAASIADTEVLWINGQQIFRSVNSQRFSSSETYFVSVGEAVLKPGPNDFVFLLGHYRTGSSGPKSCSYPQYRLVWAANSGLMYREGHYVAHDYESGGTTYHNVTNSADFVNLIDPGDGSLLTLTKQPPAALMPVGATYVPRFDSLRFGRNADSRCTLDIGGLADFPQNGLMGCPCVTNGSMILSGAWTFTSDDLAVHPLEVAAGAGVTFDNATITASVSGLPRSGTVVLHAEPGATVTGLPSVAVTGGGNAIWELRREESAEGIDLVLWGRPRGMVMTIK